MWLLHVYHMVMWLVTWFVGGDALVNSGVMESLLQVLDWRAVQPMNITVNTCTCGCEHNGTCTCMYM